MDPHMPFNVIPIRAIYNLIREDPNIFEVIDRKPFAHTPMHQAAAEGSTQLVLEIMMLKPSLARKLNLEGFSPLHIALQNEHYVMVRRMVEMDSELVRVRGRDGVTPLHYVANLGYSELLAKLVSACPMSLQDITSRSQTALHLAVALRNIDQATESVGILLEGLKRISHSGIYLNWKDDHGNTPLHVAVAVAVAAAKMNAANMNIRADINATRVVKALIDTKSIDFTATNTENLTALDISNGLAEDNQIRIILKNSVADTVLAYDSMASVEERLNTTARNGCINTLYSVIHDDPDVLDRIDARPFIDTPLHIAASSETIDFAMEMMRLKPSFARKLNQDGFTPLHLALQNNKYEMVWCLVEADNDLVRVKGRSGETALHLAARNRNTLNLLRIFLRICPDSIRDVTIKRQTALHIAVMNSNIGAFDYLVDELLHSTRKNFGWLELEILNKADANGDTLLHIAVRTNQPEVVQKLLDCEVENRRNSRNELPGQIQPENHNHDIDFRTKIVRLLSHER